MSELDREPDINELTELAYQIATSVGMTVTPDKIARSLVVLAFGGVEEARERIGKQVRWTPEDYTDAGVLTDLIKRSLGGEAIAQISKTAATNVSKPGIGIDGTPIHRKSVLTEIGTLNRTPQLERSSDRNWQELAGNLDEAFGFDTGSTEEWLSGKDQDNFKKLQGIFREAVGIDTPETTGLLMVSFEGGGVGFSLTQAKIMGVGLGYRITEENKYPQRHDVDNSPSFDQYVNKMRMNQRDPSKFRDSYFIALQKLCLFGEQQTKEGNSTPE